MNIPQHLIYPLEPFAAGYARVVREGESHFRDSRVAFVGLARNCEEHLAANLVRFEKLVETCGEWRLHVETNDNTDGTDQVLTDFAAAHRQATFTSQRLGREQYGAEFAGRRTIALAEYRTACQRWVADTCPAYDLVVVIDWDAWGGWSHSGVMHGIGALHATPDAYGMAGVALMEWQVPGQWLHYDAWAYRLNSYWDDYTAGLGGWKHIHIPPVGSPPFPVCSAFGGMAVYETDAYLAGNYDGSDCEHVTFHKTIAERTGSQLYLDPAMRMVMHWLEQSDGGQHGDH